MPRWRSSSSEPGGFRPAAGGHRRGGAWLAAVAGLALLVLPWGCLLSTREDEGAGGTEGAVWRDPSSLGIALGNMKRALEATPKNMTNYGRSFSGAHFEMVLDEADRSELGHDDFETWDASLEEQRMNGILNATEATLKVYWTARDSVDISPTVQYYKDLSYRLEFREASRSVNYSGKVDLYFEDNGAGLWYITRWVDKRDGSPNRTWGWLRARNQVEF